MVLLAEVKALCRDLSPPDVERAVKFNATSRDEHRIAYNMFLDQKKLPRQIFINGYNAMFSAAALFLAKKYNAKLDTVRGSSHRNMRTVLEFYTRESVHHQRLLSLYEEAVEKFQFFSQQYSTQSRFASKVVKDLMSKGFQDGKKVTYYQESVEGKKDPLDLDVKDAKDFIDEVVEPFLYILDELTK